MTAATTTAAVAAARVGMAGIPALNQLNQLNVLNQVDVFLWLTAPLDSFSHWSGYPGSSQKNATLGGFAVVQIGQRTQNVHADTTLVCVAHTA